jgi:hypothetical protein
MFPRAIRSADRFRSGLALGEEGVCEFSGSLDGNRKLKQRSVKNTEDTEIAEGHREEEKTKGLLEEGFF